MLPVALTALTCGVLLAAIVQTRRRDVVAWKSSGLALLFQRLEGGDIPGETFESRAALDQTAEEMTGRVVDGGNWIAFIVSSGRRFRR